MSEMVLNNQATIEMETATQTNDSDANEKMNFFELLLVGRYFLPILSSIGAAFVLFAKPDGFLFVIGAILVMIGGVAALTCCPLKLLTFPFICVPIGFTFCRGFIPFYGVADLVAAIFGTIGGFMFGLLTVAFVPAFFTIKKFFEIKD